MIKEMVIKINFIINYKLTLKNIGFGIYHWPNSHQKYIGYWKENKKHGKCHYEWLTDNWELSVR